MKPRATKSKRYGSLPKPAALSGKEGATAMMSVSPFRMSDPTVRRKDTAPKSDWLAIVRKVGCNIDGRRSRSAIIAAIVEYNAQLYGRTVRTEFKSRDKKSRLGEIQPA